MIYKKLEKSQIADTGIPMRQNQKQADPSSVKASSDDMPVSSPIH